MPVQGQDDQTPPSSESTFHPEMADTSMTKNMAPQDQNEHKRHIFRLMDLPAELREFIYYYASAPFPPIDTASIRNTPDEIRFPVIAQLSQQTRKEALAVFYRSREVHLSLHCERNIKRSGAWLSHWGDDAALTDNIIFAGLHKHSCGSMFHLTLTCLHKDRDIQYRVNMRSHEDPRAEEARKAVGEAVHGYINKKIDDDRTLLGMVGKLSKSDLQNIFTLVKRLTGWEATSSADAA